MKGFHLNLEAETLANTDFRRVLYTAKHGQLVLMCLQPNEDIGLETHTENDQFFRFESGQGKVVIDGNEYEVTDGSGVIVPSGAEHNVINTSADQPLKLYTIYMPAHHKDGIVRATKVEATADAPEFDGVTTEE
jgi:mannose-6-phosphate isomerase-like protein (cupin superfamily)